MAGPEARPSKKSGRVGRPSLAAPEKGEMSETPCKSASRALFRWYLSNFPLRDGKAYFYERLHHRLMPAERLVTATLDKGFQHEAGP